MKSIAISTAAILLASSLFSCNKKKDPPVPNPTPSYANYGKLKVGNYWIYQQYKVNLDGTESSTSVHDSCYIEKDTIINGMQYFKVVRPTDFSNGISFQKDSLHYIVDAERGIIFSSEDFSSNFSVRHILSGMDTVCKVVRFMSDQNTTITTPSGTYSTSCSRELYSMFPGFQTLGASRAINTRYAQNIGIVSEGLPFFLSNPISIERRLVRYHVN